jgi:16S rRNA processing protein RimM
MPDWLSMVLVGTVARPHGIRGDVVVNPETDFVGERFAVGSVLWTQVGGVVERVTVVRAMLGGRRPIVGFEGASSVTDAERLAGAELRVPETDLAALEPGAFYLHQLAGCRVETIAGAPVGEVVRVEGGTGASVLVVAGDGGEVLIPLAASLCPTIDVERRLIVVDAPEGLLEVNAPSPRRRRQTRGAKGTA